MYKIITVVIIVNDKIIMKRHLFQYQLCEIINCLSDENDIKVYYQYCTLEEYESIFK